MTCDILFLVCATGKRFCPDFSGDPLFKSFGSWSTWLKAESLLRVVCAPSENFTSLGLSLISLILLTWYCQYRSWTEKNHACFVRSWLCVSSFSRHERVTHTEHFASIKW